MRAMSYGMLAAARFVLHTANFKRQHINRVLVWSDSESLIKRINSMTREINPRDVLKGNADTCITIQKTLVAIKNFEMKHVHAHQDRDCKNIKELPWEAQLNIRADYLAQREQSKIGRDPVLHIP